MNLAKIAVLAKVSKSAVSIALNGKPGVSEATRAEILRIARESGYAQKSRPRAGKAKTIRILAVVEGTIVSADFSRSPFFVELVARIQKATELAGYACIVSMVPLKDASTELTRIEVALPSAGILLLGTNLTSSQVMELCRYGAASVVVDTLDELLPVNMVVMNNRQGALLAADHLVRLGHRRIGFGRCVTRISNFQAREQAFVQGLANHGLGIRPEFVFPLPSSIEGSQAAFAQAIGERRAELPSAIFCENDYMAIGVIRALAGAGLSVPGDVSVVGFDDIGEASVVTPELTTVHVDKDQIAEFAVERLLAIMKGEATTPMKQIVDVDLVVRQSTVAV